MSNQATRLAEEAKLLLTRAMTAQADAREMGDYTKSKAAHTAAEAAIDALLALVQPAVSEEAPAGFWLAPMEPDTAMIRAGFYFETDENVRRFWYALRDHWLARHPKSSQLARDFPPMGGLTECDMGDSYE